MGCLIQKLIKGKKKMKLIIIRWRSLSLWFLNTTSTTHWSLYITSTAHWSLHIATDWSLAIISIWRSLIICRSLNIALVLLSFGLASSATTPT